MRIVSIGEVLWDVLGESEFLGGAPLNFSAHSHRLGSAVALVSAVGEDTRGQRTLSAIESLGLCTDFITTTSKGPTGIASVVIEASGNVAFTFNRPCAYDLVEVDDTLLSAISSFSPNWIYFGTLAQTDVASERRLQRVLETCPSARRFYDMNLRTGHWNLPLIERLSHAATVLKLNEEEAEQLFKAVQPSAYFTLETFCRIWAEKYKLETICVTLGGRGCAVFMSGHFEIFPGHPVTVADTVGAGDAFAAAFLHGLELGWPPERTACFANGLGALVASRNGATPEWTTDELDALTCGDSIASARPI